MISRLGGRSEVKRIVHNATARKANVRSSGWDGTEYCKSGGPGRGIGRENGEKRLVSEGRK